MKNETTSARIASIASRILSVKESLSDVWFWTWNGKKYVPTYIPWADIQALAASALTQAADTAERETLRKGHLPRGHKRIRRHRPIARNGKVRG